MSKAKVFKDGEEASIRYLHNALGQRVFQGEPTASQTLPNQETLGQGFIDWLKKNFSWLYATAQANTSIGTAFVYTDGALPSWAVLGDYDNGSASGNGRSEYIWLPTGDGAIPVGLFRNGRFFAIHTDHLGTPRLMTNDLNKPVWQWPYSAFGTTKPTGILQATPMPKQAMTNQPVLLKATGAAQALALRHPGQMNDAETGTFQNIWRGYWAMHGRYTQSDPIGLEGGINTFLYVDGDPLRFTDRLGLAGDDHSTGQWKQCSKGCRMRIDFKLVNGVKVRHLHWECKKTDGVGGEFGGTSHGGTLEDAPEHIKECARKHGFEPDPAPDCPPEPSLFDRLRDALSPPQSYDPRTDRWLSAPRRPPFIFPFPGRGPVLVP